MSTVRKKKKDDLREPESYSVQIQLDGESITAPIHTSAFVLEPLFESFRPKLIDKALRVIKDTSTAEDIVQSSLLSAYCWLNNGRLYAIKLSQGYLIVRGNGSSSSRRARARWKKVAVAWTLEQWLKGKPVKSIHVIEDPSAWIQKIVLNNALKYYNKRKKHQEFFANPKNWDLAEDPRCPNPEKDLIQKEEYAKVRQCVAALPVHYREVMELRYLQDQDYSFQAIAEKLNRPVHTVTSQATRATRMLKEVLEEQRIVKDGRLTKRKKQA